MGCSRVWGTLATFATLAAANTIPAASPLVYWSARTVPGGTIGEVVADWVGASATIVVTNNFTYITARIVDGCAGGNKFVVRMRDAEGVRSLDVATFYTSGEQFDYVLFASAGRASFWGRNATFSLIKAVEARFTQCAAGGNLTFVSFSSDGAFLSPTAPARRIEVIGDSISAGDLVYCEDVWGAHMTVNNSLWADNWAVSYGSLLCDTFGAACSAVAWGGMGLCAGDTPAWLWPTLPEVYPSALAWQVDVDGAGAPTRFPWNFSAWVPQAVLINLGTNDAAGGRFNNATFSRLFTQTYISFVLNISAHYGGSSGDPSLGPTFFLGFGPMSDAYAGAVASAAGSLSALGVPVHVLNYTLPGGASPACGHPSAADHAAMAHGARGAIAAAMGWQ